MRVLAAIFLAGTIWWTLPVDLQWQEMTTYLFECAVNSTNPDDWVQIATVPYGETMWVGTVTPGKFYGGFFLLNGMESNWDTVYCPFPSPEPNKGKHLGWGKGNK